MGTLKDRIRLLTRLTGTNQSQFAKVADLSPGFISDLLKGSKANLSRKSAKNICRELNIEYDWLMSGKGKAPESITLQPSKESNSDSQYVTVNIITLAGNGNTHDEENYEPVDTIQFEKNSVTIDGKVITSAVKAEGDSMYPTIVDGGIVGIDFDDKRPIDNGIFLIRFPDIGIAIKRLQLKTGGMLAVGDNAQVEPELIPKDILQQGLILGRVRWIHNKL